MIASDAIYSMSRVAGSRSLVNGKSTGCKEKSPLNLSAGIELQAYTAKPLDWISCLSANADGKIHRICVVCK